MICSVCEHQDQEVLSCFILQMLLTFKTFVIGLGGSMYAARIKYRQIVYQIRSRDTS